MALNTLKCNHSASLGLKGLIQEEQNSASPPTVVGFSEAKASVHGESYKLAEWVSDWVRDFSPRAISAMEGATETKFATKVAWGEDDARTSSTRIARAQRRESARCHTLRWKYTRRTETMKLGTSYRRTYDWRHIGDACNQPEAFASDLGDD